MCKTYQQLKQNAQLNHIEVTEDNEHRWEFSYSSTGKHNRIVLGTENINQESQLKDVLAHEYGHILNNKAVKGEMKKPAILREIGAWKTAIEQLDLNPELDKQELRDVLKLSGNCIFTYLSWDDLLQLRDYKLEGKKW
jgi:Zn-dependent protease with chaperone function